MKLLGLVLAAAAITLPHGAVAQEKVGEWTIQRVGSDCKAITVRGSGESRRELAVTSVDGIRRLTMFAPGWTFSATDQPPVAVYFVGPGSLWPNLTAVVEMSPQNQPVLHIGFAPERAAELDALLSQTARLQVIHNQTSIGVFETPDASAAVTAMGRCAQER